MKHHVFHFALTGGPASSHESRYSAGLSVAPEWVSVETGGPVHQEQAYIREGAHSDTFRWERPNIEMSSSDINEAALGKSRRSPPLSRRGFILSFTTIHHI